jgi:hypothetical protein
MNLAATQAALARYSAQLAANYDMVRETKFWLIHRARQKKV